MWKLLVIFFIICFDLGSAQNCYKITYSSNDKIHQNSILKVSNSESSYELTYKISDNDNQVKKQKPTNSLTGTIIPFEILYNKQSNDEYYFEGAIKDGDRAFYTEKKNAAKWSLTDEYKEVLGYPCRKAVRQNTTHKIVAWFTNTIGVIGGPLRVQGLPGLVLEYGYKRLEADKFELHLTPVIIEKISESAIQRPSPKAVQMSFDDYLTEQLYFYDKGMYRMLKSADTKNFNYADSPEN